MKTVTAVNQKGGVGKSSTAEALASGLMRRGFKVLAIDLDAQGNLTYTGGKGTDGAGVYEVLTNQATAGDAIKRGGLWDMLSASKRLATADANISETGKEYRLKEALREVDGLYDYAVIDTPPALGILTVNALTAADYAVIPAQADIYSIQGIDDLSVTLEAVKKYTNANLTVSGILLTRYNPRSVLSRSITKVTEEQIAARLGTKVFTTKIREAVAVKEAQLKRAHLYEYAPKSTASQDYEAFVDEFLRGVE